jgi:hypothetical protein
MDLIWPQVEPYLLQVAPFGSIDNYNPTYTWKEMSSATWYYLWVDGPSGNRIKQWYQAVEICSAGTCSVSPNVTLRVGAHQWWVQTWNSAGYGPWSGGMNFRVPSPDSTTLVAPIESTGSIAPTYIWNEVPNVTWYFLWVDGPSGNIIKQWYTSAQAKCNGTTCSVTPAVNLSAGSHTWWVQTWNDAGYGPWSNSMTFTVSPPGLPGKATLVSPTGNIGMDTPTYTWNEISSATWYYLWVNGPSGNVIKQWYTSAEANCNSTTCSVTPAVSLSSGTHSWWIQTWNNAGYGPWSNRMDFLVP